MVDKETVQIAYAEAGDKLSKIHSFLVQNNKLSLLHYGTETEDFLESGDIDYLYQGSITVLRNEIKGTLKLLYQLVNNEFEFSDDDEDGWFLQEHCDWIEQELNFQLNYYDLLFSFGIKVPLRYRQTTIANYVIFLNFMIHEHKQKDRIPKIINILEDGISNDYPNYNQFNYKKLYNYYKH